MMDTQNSEDVLFLAESEDSQELFIANSNDEESEIYLADSENQKSELNRNLKFSDENNFDELEEIYDILKISEKPQNLTFEEYFKSNPEIFKIVETDYYKSLTSEQFSQFEKKCTIWTEQANKKWRSVENNHKIEEIDDALGTLKRIFKYEKATNDYSKEIKRTLGEHLNSVLSQKTKDKILDISEIQELLEIATSIHYIQDNQKEKKSFLTVLKNTSQKNFFKIESFEETFARLVSKKPEIERLTNHSCETKLFEEYKSFSEINSQIYNQILDSDEKLKENMKNLLEKKNLLVSNLDFFIKDFLEVEIQKKGEFFFNVPLSSEYYYYLKGTATNKYELTEEQWRQIVLIRNIKLDTEFSIAFIMGKHKSSTFQGIIKILEENPKMAFERIFAGDVETYFEHIGRRDISNEISKLKNENNSKNIVFDVVRILKSELGENQNSEIIEEKTETLESLIENNADLKKLVLFVVKHKDDESLIKKITSDSKTISKLQNLFFLKTKKVSYNKFLLNIMNELLQVKDILQYSFSFLSVAKKIQEDLVLQNDCFTFLAVYKPLIQNATSMNIIKSENEIQNYGEANKKMLALYDAELEIQNQSKTQNKHKFSLFRRGEK